MKVAFWALGIMVLGVFGLVLINLFGNITVTNQLNYTTMKNDVEASMYDALDIAHYRAGFCLCTDRDKTDGKWVFTDESEYELSDIVYEGTKETCVSKKKTCEILKGEYRINKKVFTESLIRRFASIVSDNNKDYEITVQNVIEYPPKVSVRINSKDTEFSPTEKNTDGYTIVNQMDAIIETWSEFSTSTPTPTPTTIATDEKEKEKKKVWCWITDYRDYDSGVNGGNCSTSYKCCQIGCKIKFNYRKKEGATDWKCTQYGGEGTGGTCYISWSSKKEKEANCTENRDPVDDNSGNGGGSTPSGGGEVKSCSWWNYSTTVTCKKGNVEEFRVNIANDKYDSCNAAKSACEANANSVCGSGYSASYTCEGRQRWVVNFYDGSSTEFVSTCKEPKYCSEYSNWSSCSCKG